MKKFTSLFALLSCLCVVSTQANNVTIYVKAPNAQNLDNLHLYWWDANEKLNWADAPTFSNLNSTVINDETFYYKELSYNEGGAISIKFYDGTSQNNQQTNNIIMEAKIILPPLFH